MRRILVKLCANLSHNDYTKAGLEAWEANNMIEVFYTDGDAMYNPPAFSPDDIENEE